MSRPWPLAALLAAVLALALAAPARAATFCAHQPAGCAGAEYGSVQAALDAAAAAPGRDRVEVGDHAGAAGETVDVAPGNAVDVVGVGPDVTILTAGATPIRIREASAVVSGLAIVAGEGATRLLDVAAGTLQDVTVTPRESTAVAVALGAGTLRRVTVVDRQRYGDALQTAIAAGGAGAVMEDVTADAGTGRALDVSAGSVALTRVALTGRNAARVTGGTLTADDSGFAGERAALDVSPASAATVTLRSSTVDGGETGLGATCAPGATADVALLDVLAATATTDLAQSGAGCAVSLDHVGYETRSGTFADGAGVLGGPMALWGSSSWPVVGPGWDTQGRDAGTTRPAAAGETDLLGRPRVVDAARDLGALEYQHRPPTVTLTADATAQRGGTASAQADGRDPDGEGLHHAWTVDGVPVTAAFSRWPELGADLAEIAFPVPALGPHTVTVTVTDPSGLTATARQVVTVVEPPGWVVSPPAPVITPVTEWPGAGLTIAARDRRVSKDHRLLLTVICTKQRSNCPASVRVLLRGRHGLAVTLGPKSSTFPAHTASRMYLTIPAKARAALRRAKVATATASAWSGPRATGTRLASATFAVRP